MKKGIIAALFAAALSVVACYNDDDLQKKVDELDQRVTTLEEQVKELNEKTVPGLQATVAAIQDGVFVSKVSKGTDGTTIYFSDGTTAFIKNGDKGEKGEDAVAPVIGVTEVDGVFYWTVNGEIVKDAEGNNIAVYQTTPQFRINQGKWEVSYDGGTTWTVVPEMGESTSVPISIEDDENTVTFYIGGESYVIQKEHAFFISFNISDRKNIGVPEGEEFMYEYTINGLKDDDELEVDILNVTAGWEAKVVSLPNGDTPGYISVKNLENKDGKVFVYAANGRGKTDIKYLVFEGGVLTAEMNVKTVGAEGGNLVLTVVTNMDYELYIPKTQSWLTKEPETKATHTDVITLVAAENTTGAYRSAEVDVILQNMDTKAFVVLQTPNQSVATDLSSLANVEAGTEVTLYSEVVVASSSKGFVISDGKSNLFIPEESASVGDVVEIAGTVTEDGFVASAVEVKAVGHELPAETRFYYFGYGQIYDCVFTAVNGILAIDGDDYSIELPTGDVIALATPSSTEGLTAGDVASAKGYIVGYEEGEEGDTYAMVAAEVASAPFAKTGEISYTVNKGESYPDAFLWEGHASSYVQYSFYKKTAIGENTEEEFAWTASFSAADDYQYDYLHSYGSRYTPAYLASMLLYAPAEVCDAKFDYGEYLVVATGMDEYGRLSGEYGFYEFIKEAPVSNATYEDYLGTWQSGSTLVEVVADEEGSSYIVKDLISIDSGAGTSDLKATFEDGKMIIMEQVLGGFENSNYGSCTSYFTGLFKYGSSIYPHYTGPEGNADAPAQAIVAMVDEDGALSLEGGSSEFGSSMVGYAVRWIIDEGDNAGKGNWLFNSSKTQNLPAIFERPSSEAKEAFAKWLGNYTFTINEKTYSAEVKTNVLNSSFIIDFSADYIDGYTPVATWDEASDKLTIAAQNLGTWEHSTYGAVQDQVRGIIMYNEKLTSVSGSYPVATLSMTDGNITVESAGQVSISAGAFDIIGMSLYGKCDAGSLSFVDSADMQMFPFTLTKAAATSTSKTAAKAPVKTNKAVAVSMKAVSEKVSASAKQQGSSTSKKVTVKTSVNSVRVIK